MAISADILRRLAALNLPGEAFQIVLEIMAEVQGADDARRSKQRIRQKQKRSRDKMRDSHGDGDVTVTRQSRQNDVTSSPPYPLKEERKKESKIPEPRGSGNSQADLERELFSRGRQVCGKSSGGLISTLLKAKQFNIELARSVLELAATKHDPREFVAAATRVPINGKRTVHQAADDLVNRIAALDEPAPGGDLCGPAREDIVRRLPAR